MAPPAGRAVLSASLETYPSRMLLGTLSIYIMGLLLMGFYSLSLPA